MMRSRRSRWVRGPRLLASHALLRLGPAVAAGYSSLLWPCCCWLRLMELAL